MLVSFENREVIGPEDFATIWLMDIGLSTLKFCSAGGKLQTISEEKLFPSLLQKSVKSAVVEGFSFIIFFHSYCWRHRMSYFS